MNDFEKLCSHIDTELHKIEDKGLNQGNLDTAYKLIDMYKDMVKARYYKLLSEDMEEGMGGYNMGHSGAYPRYVEPHRMVADRVGYAEESSYARGRGRKRDSMGRYMSRYSGAGYDEYQAAKNEYRHNKSSECKSNVIDMLEQYMGDIEEELTQMSRDADCQEERQTILKYLDKMRNMVT